MKHLKNNCSVKTAYAYVNLVYKLFFLLIILLLIPKITGAITPLNRVHSLFINVDLFEIWIIDKPISSFTTWLFVFLVNAGLVAVIFYCLKRLNAFLKNIYNEKPFVLENGKHLRIIGIYVMVFTTLIYIIKTFESQVNSLPISQTLKFLYLCIAIIGSIFNPYLIIGLIVFVIEEVIVRAAELKEEQDLTV